MHCLSKIYIFFLSLLINQDYFFFYNMTQDKKNNDYTESISSKSLNYTVIEIDQ